MLYVSPKSVMVVVVVHHGGSVVVAEEDEDDDDDDDDDVRADKVQPMKYCSSAKYLTIVQYLLLVFTLFEILEGQMHGGNELEASNCN
jgi:hypothetical protein